jgi:3-oxoacyl-[acyl-carrier-protein] synthase-3
MNGPTNVVLRSTGCSLPSKVVPNDWFAGIVETSDEWIRTRTGIRERRFVAPTESSVTLGIDAAQKALIAADLVPDDIDLIICATVTPDYMCPSNACLIQAALGCRPIPAFDISAACTGFLYAMSIANQYIRSGTAKNVLVVGADVLSRTLDFSDRNTCILFGDGAGAAILSASDNTDHGIRSINTYADGVPGELIRVPSCVTLPEGPEQKQLKSITLNGREVFRFAVRRMIELTQDAILECRKYGLEISLLIPHQVNQRIIDAALEATGFPSSKVMVNLDKYGNTSGASVPIALDEAMRSGRIGPGDTILLVAFGGGLSWGSTIITL